MYPIEVQTERLILRVIDSAWAPATAAYFARNRAFREPWSPAVDDTFFSLAWQQHKLASERASISAGQIYKLWLAGKDDPATVIGFVSFNNIIRGAFLSCHLGYELDGALINRGLITEALRAAIAVIFTDLELHRIEANIMPRNTRSIRVVQKLGFVCEGLARRYLRINGVWEDHEHYVLLNDAV